MRAFPCTLSCPFADLGLRLLVVPLPVPLPSPSWPCRHIFRLMSLKSSSAACTTYPMVSPLCVHLAGATWYHRGLSTPDGPSPSAGQAPGPPHWWLAGLCHASGYITLDPCPPVRAPTQWRPVWAATRRLNIVSTDADAGPRLYPAAPFCPENPRGGGCGSALLAAGS